jgi:hypothetical protein
LRRPLLSRDALGYKYRNNLPGLPSLSAHGMCAVSITSQALTAQDQRQEWRAYSSLSSTAGLLSCWRNPDAPFPAQLARSRRLGTVTSSPRGNPALHRHGVSAARPPIVGFKPNAADPCYPTGPVLRARIFFRISRIVISVAGLPSSPKLSSRNATRYGPTSQPLPPNAIRSRAAFLCHGGFRVFTWGPCKLFTRHPKERSRLLCSAAETLVG